MYITLEDYTRWFEPIDASTFDRLAFEANKLMDKYTTGVDGVRKLRDFFPEDDADDVKYTASKLVNTLYQLHEIEQIASETRGYTKTENGLQRKVISRLEAGNESISYMEAQASTTEIDKAANDGSKREALLARIIRDGLSGVTDRNGVNLLYMGVYHRRGVV